jgi:phosphoglycolate phosphatase
MTKPVLLFDLDGTISDPIQGIGRCLNYALDSLAFPLLPQDAIAPYIGPPLDETFRVLTGSTDVGLTDRFVDKFRERFAEIGFSENKLYPGISEALATLSERGLTLGICTSKRSDFADTILKMFDLRDMFKFISGGDIGIHKYQQVEALLKQNVIDDNTIMIGDRYIDIVAGHKNGLKTAGVLWGYGTKSELEAESPRYLFEKRSELVTTFG